MTNPMYGQNKADDAVDVKITDRRTYHFGAAPVVIDEDSTLADGVDTNIILHQYSDGLQLAVQNIGTQTILIPAVNTGGMIYSYDQTDNEGVQWVMSDATQKGITDGDFINRFTVGTAAFEAELTFSVADVSGTDDLYFGFRKVETFQADINSYDEMASLGLPGTANPNNVNVVTILNAASNSETDTTENLADGVTTTWGVHVTSAGVVTFTINGHAPSTTATYTFDANEVVTPFFYYINATAAQAGNIILQKLVVGRQQ